MARIRRRKSYFRNLFRIFILSILIGCLLAIDWKEDWVGCRFQFSEAQLNYRAHNNAQFIELQKVCKQQTTPHPGSNAEKFILVFIDGQDEKILMTCDLRGKLKGSGRSFEEKYFYIIGSRSAQQNIGWMDEGFLRISECTSDIANKDYFPMPDRPVGVALLKDTHKTRISPIPKFYRYTGEPMTEDIKKKMKSHLHDFFVYSSTNAPPQKCPLFEELYEDIQKRSLTNVFRPLQTKNVEHDFSLSRCTGTTIDPFPVRFLHSSPTPGSVNDCETAFELHLETIIDSVSRLPNSEVFSVPQSADRKCPYTKFSPQANSVAQLNVDLLEKEIKSIVDKLKPKVTPMEVDIAPCGQQVVPIQPAVAGLPVAPVAVKLIHKCDEHSFRRNKPRLVTLLEQALHSYIKLEDVCQPDLCYWIRADEQQPMSNTRLTCGLCKDLRDSGIVHEHPDSTFYDKACKGDFLSRITKNKNPQHDNAQFVKAHVHTKSHKLAVVLAKGKDQGLTGDQLVKFLLNSQEFKDYLAPTKKLLKTVWRANKMGLSFNQFPVLMEYLVDEGVKVGKAYHSKNAMATITQFMSKKLHESNLHYWKTEKPQCSIILDGSIDRAMKNNYVVLFHCVDSKMNVDVRLYRFIEIEGQSAKEIFAAMEPHLRTDGLKDFLKENMVGYSTDGCNTVISGLKTEFYNWLTEGMSEEDKRQFYVSWCSAHKIELTVEHGFKKFRFWDFVTTLMRDAAKFYNTQSFKVKVVVEDVCQRLGLVYVQIPQLFDIRWVLNRLKCSTSLLRMLQSIYTSTETFMTDKRYADKKEKAGRLLDRLTDPRMLTHLTFMNGVSKCYAAASMTFQNEKISVVDRTPTFNTLVTCINGLDDEIQELAKGEFVEMPAEQEGQLRRILKEATCNGQSPCSLKDFENPGPNMKVELYGEPVKHCGNIWDGPGLPPELSEKAPEMVTALLIELYTYFDPTNDMNFEIFSPSQLESFMDTTQKISIPSSRTVNSVSTTAMSGKSFATQAFLQIAQWLRLTPTNADPTTVSKEYFDFVGKVVKLAEFPIKKQLTSANFYQWLYTKKDEIGWTPFMMKVVQKVVGISSVSSAAERYFSYYNHVKTCFRARLKPKTTEDILRVAKACFHDLDAVLDWLAYEWTKEHRRADDSQYERAFLDPDDGNWFLSTLEYMINEKADLDDPNGGINADDSGINVDDSDSSSDDGDSSSDDGDSSVDDSDSSVDDGEPMDTDNSD